MHPQFHPIPRRSLRQPQPLQLPRIELRSNISTTRASFSNLILCDACLVPQAPSHPPLNAPESPSPAAM